MMYVLILNSGRPPEDLFLSIEGLENEGIKMQARCELGTYSSAGGSLADGGAAFSPNSTRYETAQFCI